ncbi:transcriptional regulator [Spirochaetia bacterium]|nr:transcriptional regulator [Spirochaetia bacterium]
MGFRENLKEELTYKNMMVKELSVLSGVNKRSIDTYLREKGSIPSADAAVKIANTLGVSVEYLITGRDTQIEKLRNTKIHELIQVIETLDQNSREVMLTLGKALKRMQDVRK